MGKPHYIYGLYEGEVCTYIGRTQIPSHRAKQHRWAGRTGEFRVLETIGDYLVAHEREASLIAEIKPRDNRLNNCRGVACKGRMPTEEARRIWTEEKLLTNGGIIQLMPGWTVSTAIYHFGPRRDHR